MVISQVVLPIELLAVTVYTVAADVAVGVPLITPVVVFRLSPAGNGVSTLYEVTTPVTVGVRLVIAVFLVNVFGEV